MSFKYIYLFFLLCFSFAASGQTAKENFFSDFDKANAREKVRQTAALSPFNLTEIYPLIKDTLEKIKRDVYFNGENKEARFLFDVIEANLAHATKNYDKAILITENCLRKHARDINDSLMCYSIQKSAYVKLRNFFKAYEINARMDAYWQRKSDSVNINFGASKSSLFASLGFMSEAIDERRKEFDKHNNKNDTDEIYNYYSDLGIYFNRLKMSDSAAVFFLKALRLIEHKKITPEKAVHYGFLKGVAKGNLGLSYFNNKQPEKAIPLIKEDIYYSAKSNNFQSLFLGHKVIAECYLLTGNLNAAKRHIDSAAHVLETKLADGVMKQHLFFVRSKLYEAQGDFKSANLFLNKYYGFRDSLALAEKEQNLKNAEIAFRVEQKEKELKEKNHMLEHKELEEAKAKTFRAYSLAALILLMVVIVFLILINFFSNKREKELHAKNEQIRKQNIQIEQSLKEKETLIREIHHRVKNNLQIITSMLSLQISKQEGTGSEEVLREAKQRISSIALTHQMLYQNANMARIPINEYITSLVRQIEHSLPPSEIELVIDLEPSEKKVNIDNAVPLGLLINELLTNAYKHAFPNHEKGIITVFLRKEGDKCLIGVKDNGVGLPEDFNIFEKKSMGMDLIHILAEQLDARLIIESNGGSSFTLETTKSRLFV